MVQSLGFFPAFLFGWFGGMGVVLFGDFCDHAACSCGGLSWRGQAADLLQPELSVYCSSGCTGACSAS